MLCWFLVCSSILHDVLHWKILFQQMQQFPLVIADHHIKVRSRLGWIFSMFHEFRILLSNPHHVFKLLHLRHLLSFWFQLICVKTFHQWNLRHLCRFQLHVQPRLSPLMEHPYQDEMGSLLPCHNTHVNSTGLCKECSFHCADGNSTPLNIQHEIR